MHQDGLVHRGRMSRALGPAAEGQGRTAAAFERLRAAR